MPAFGVSRELVYKSQFLAREKSNSLSSSPAMANRVPHVDDTLYHFSDEEDRDDPILDRAFDRWEQLGDGSAQSPLFEFTMQPIGRRRRWHNVLERAQFNV